MNEIPVSIFQRKDRISNTAPLYLYGYSAYGLDSQVICCKICFIFFIFFIIFFFKAVFSQINSVFGGPRVLLRNLSCKRI
jgi:hypothetical protein